MSSASARPAESISSRRPHREKTMPIDPSAVGFTSPAVERSWTSTDSLLYALGVGAGVDDLGFTTENTTGIQQQALPTMPVVLSTVATELWQALGSFDLAGVLHGAE